MQVVDIQAFSVKDSRIQGFKDSNKLITFIEFTIVVILK